MVGLSFGVLRLSIKNLWFYFRRGHGVYLLYVMWFISWSTVVYTLLLERIDFARSIFPTYPLFVFTLVVFYPSLAVFIGYLDKRHGQLKTDMQMMDSVSPVNAKILKELEEIKALLNEN